MDLGISHDRADEDIEVKTRWFQSLSEEERAEIFCEFTDLMFENNPGLAEGIKADDPPPSASVRIVSLPRS